MSGEDENSPSARNEDATSRLKSSGQPGKAARNEQRKAVATTLNGLSAGGIIAIVVQALAGQVGPEAVAVALLLFVVAQTALHYILRRLED